ncbi:MAG: ChrR family anti-sigma-E factor [Porticoccaceae bacterium]|nr:ChrR family anti-sigma-E factor [Porticoccaceae bacterium]
MNSKTVHHPETSMLLEFSAGTLETAASICVSAHLHFCAHCRDSLLRLDQVGSKLMEDSQAEPVDEALFASVMERIDRLEDGASEPDKYSQVGDYPPSVNKLIEADDNPPLWRRLSGSVDVASLKTGQKKFEVALHRICAGGKTPKHDHGGLEYTVVLKGSFSDERSVYSEGDFILRKPGDTHQPMGAQNGECICLSAQSAPIKLSSPLGFIMNNLLRINPR